MKALSVRQPWAWLICAGIKDYENRSWKLPKTEPFPVPVRIYVHASKAPMRPDEDRDDWIRARITPRDWVKALKISGGHAPDLHDPTYGAIIGEVDIIGEMQAYPDLARMQKELPDYGPDGPLRWFEGPWGFHLDNAELYETPVPYRGRLGFFDVGCHAGRDGDCTWERCPQ